MTRLLFYLRYAARNLRRSARWTMFAVFCIGAGVATVVALRSLGLAIGDSLVDNARVSNHGDITLSYADGANSAFSFLGGERGDANQEVTFSSSEIGAYRAWASVNNAQIAFYTRAFSLQVTAVDAVDVGRPQLISTLLIDPQTFPPTGEIIALEPAGAALRDLFSTPNSVVISENMASQQNLQVGDTVRVSNTTEPFIVSGIVPTETEAGTRDFFAAFFGFAYFHIDRAETLQIDADPNVLSIALPDGSDVNAALHRLNNLIPQSQNWLLNVITVTDIIEQNKIIGDYIGRFIVIMGLGALLIGGVGIINTMLVMVGRRTNEIAALKTFGLKGRQIGSLFLAEAFLLGIMGSVTGAVMGVLLSIAVNRYGEAFLQQKLIWRIYPEAIVYGLGLGMVVTLVFGILPILTANRVRPAIILRPNETHIPGVGVLHSLIALLLVVVVIGLVAGQIIGFPVAGIIGVALTLLILSILVGILWVIVWLVGKLPSFGYVDFRLALRNLSSRRLRTATTLLALSAGMFALSSITFVGVGTREILQFQLTRSFGGNVLVFPVISMMSPTLGNNIVQNVADRFEGVYNTRIAQYTAEILRVDGQEPEVNIPFVDDQGVTRRVDRAFRSLPLQARISDNPDLSSGTIIAGRDLTPEDRGQNVIVLSASLGFGVETTVHVGSELVLRMRGVEYPFTVVGILQDSGGFVQLGQAFIPPDTISGNPGFQLNVLQASDDQLNEVLLALSEVPFVFAIDITFIDGLLKRLIDQFSAIPTVVGLLSLLAAAVSMANTVSLATLERRRQIGILKAIGLKGRRVLWVMLLENTLVGLLGGLIGIGVSALGVSILTALGQGDIIPIPADAMPVAVALVVASVIIAWAATFLSARVAVRERVANVLRYE